MEINSILQYITYVIYAVLLITWPSRKKKIFENLGKCLLPLQRKKSNLVIFVIIFALMLIVIQHFRKFDLLITVVLCGCAILGVEVAIRDKIFGALAGVYEKGLVIDGRYLLYNEIVAFPELGYEPDDSIELDEMYQRALKIVTNNSGTIHVGFSNLQEKEEALEIILKQEPRLDIR